MGCPGRHGCVQRLPLAIGSEQVFAWEQVANQVVGENAEFALQVAVEEETR